MKNKSFILQPVSGFPAPGYPSKSSFSSALKISAALASGVGVLVGFGCTVAFEENPDLCETGEAMCRDAATLVVCDENHVRQVINCAQYCISEYNQDSTSHGCNTANVDNMCQCDNGIIDGMIAQCYPDEIACSGPDNITYCDVSEGEYTGIPKTVSCSTYCRDVFGWDYYSYQGCTEDDPENLCNCEYDIIDGDMPECMPSELRCLDDGTRVAICNESNFFDYFECNEKCEMDLGEGAISLGCVEDDTEDPCKCVIPEK